MKTQKTQTPVTCLCCRKQTATHMIKDVGLKTYPVCDTCKQSCMVVESEPVAAEASAWELVYPDAPTGYHGESIDPIFGGPDDLPF